VIEDYYYPLPPNKNQSPSNAKPGTSANANQYFKPEPPAKEYAKPPAKPEPPVKEFVKPEPPVKEYARPVEPPPKANPSPAKPSQQSGQGWLFG